MADTKDFPGAFAALREILKSHADGMIVHADKPTDFTVITRAIGPNKKPIWFAAVLHKKSAVTFHLLPLYYNPGLQSEIPAALLARKQGKACFNFRRNDPQLFAAIDALTRLARERWQHYGFLEPGPVPPERFEAALRAGGSDPEKIARIPKAKAAASTAKRKATLRKKAAVKKKKT
jgi:hypothetical protein